ELARPRTDPLLGPLDGVIDRRVHGNGIKKEKLGRTGQESGTHPRLKLAEGLREMCREEVLERQPASHDDVFDRVGKGGVARGEIGRLKGTNVKLGEAMRLPRKPAKDGVT